MRRGLGRVEFVRRRAVLRETLRTLEPAEAHAHYRALSERNLERWRNVRDTPLPSGLVEVFAGDWGEVTAAVTRRYGECFAVLNMANAFVPGGGYVEGMPAQEENMFRRTDCHLRVDSAMLQPDGERYLAEMTALISAKDGRVYLDTGNPRVCLRGAEDRDRSDLGYRWLPDEEVFPFYELRSAANDLRDGRPFDPGIMRRRIAAQLATLQDAGVRFAVLGAFGCGAFLNPAAQVARIYRECIEDARDSFALIVFAIFHAGYGPGNYTPFAEAFRAEE